MTCHTMARSVPRRAVLLAALALPASKRPAHAQIDPEPTASPDGGTARTPARNLLSSDGIRTLLTEHIEQGRETLGYVCGIADTAGARLIAVGQPDADDGRPLDGASVFEIGSITKVFTALLLADMALHGEVALTDPVGKYLPPEGRPHAFDGKDITLLDLATHTSGLPRLPANFRPADPANPYADYTVARMYEFVSGYAPRYYPGSHFEYSNLGFGLLGHALALRAGRSYEALVIDRICTPLAMNDTRITLTPSMRQRLVPGHDLGLRRVANWDVPALAGAGALRSTAHDLMLFLDAAQGRRPTGLSRAFAALLETRRPTDSANLYAAAGWFVQAAHGDELIWKDGGTGGYATFIGISARTSAGVVLLSNSSANVTRLGRHLLDAEFPAPAIHRQIALDPATLAALAGRYQLAPRIVLTVTPRGGRLMVQLTGQEELQVFPESDTQFFYRAVDAQLTFHLRPDGPADSVVLHQNGRNMQAVRLP